MGFSVICAVARDGAIGVTRDGVPGLPWPKLRQDMAFFSSVTQAKDPLGLAQAWCTHVPQAMYWPASPDNALLVGHRTYTSWGAKPLPHRKTIILRDKTSHGAGDWPLKARSLNEALDKAQALGAPNTFVAGGARLFAEALRHPGFERLFITIVDEEYPEADTYFPGFCLKDGYFLTIGAPRDPQKWKIRNESAWITEKERPPYKFLIMEKE